MQRTWHGLNRFGITGTADTVNFHLVNCNEVIFPRLQDRNTNAGIELAMW